MLELLSLLGSGLDILGGLSAQESHNKIAEQLLEMKQEYPGSLKHAEEIYRMLADTGLPGSERMKEDVQKIVPTTLNEAREVIDSPIALLGMLNEMQTKTDASITNINIQDEMQKQKNQIMLGEFLSNVKAPTEMQLERYNNQLDLASKQEIEAGQSEMWGAAGDATSSLFNAYGAIKELGFTEDYYKYLDKFWDTKSDTKPESKKVAGEPDFQNELDKSMYDNWGNIMNPQSNKNDFLFSPEYRSMISSDVMFNNKFW